jgi:DNA primase
VSSVTDEIKARVDLVELIGRSVPLKRSGSSFKGLCPFHQEKTPSFYVFPSSHTWVCFGCGKKGSAFDWLMEREHLEFGEALRSLAQLTGVALPERRDADQEESTGRLYTLLERAQSYYNSVLWGTAGASARAYLDKRGTHEASLRTFGIGYAPPGGALLRHLQAEGFSDDELVAAGVVGQADDGRLFDFFRERVIFPIRDAQGRTIAFGGRALDSATPKYLNSRDTLLFHKQATLFAYDLARRAIGHERQAVVVEGYFDALIAHQYGYRNVVATLGTAVTDRHLQRLKPSVEDIGLALDPDAAGQAATWRALQLADQSLRAGLRPVVGPNARQRRYVPDRPVRLRVIVLPDGKDPDEVIRGDPALWPKLVQAALPVIDFALDRLASRYDLTSAQGKAAAADEIAELLAGVANPIELAHYVQQTAQVLRVDEQAVQQALRRKRRPGVPAPAPPIPPAEVPRNVADEYTLALVMRLRELNVPVDTTGLELALEQSRVLLRMIEAGAAPPDELRAVLERVQAQRPLVDSLSVDKARAELDSKRIELRKRALDSRRQELHQLLKEKPDDAELLALVDQIRSELGDIEELARGRPSVEAA